MYDQQESQVADAGAVLAQLKVAAGLINDEIDKLIDLLKQRAQKADKGEVDKNNSADIIERGSKIYGGIDSLLRQLPEMPAAEKENYARKAEGCNVAGSYWR